MSYGAIIYNGKNSLIDFDLYPASKEIPAPTRKTIIETVPYMSGVWDFSFHDGDIDEYEELKIKYSFDVIADTKVELNAQKAALLAWVHSRGEQKLYDTDISDLEYYSVYHAQASWSESDLQGLLTVEFTCYPLRRCDKEIVVTLTGQDVNVPIEYKGYKEVSPTIRVDSAAAISDGVNSHMLGAGTYDGLLTLKKGVNNIIMTGSGLLYIVYTEETL